MTATEQLRKLLDERGVEHLDKHTELVPEVSEWDSTWWRGIAGLEFHAVSDETCGREGCVYINGVYLTPKQAIAATLNPEIVRCRDCIWYRPFPGIQITYGICKKTHLEVDDNGFCVWAERWE